MRLTFLLIISLCSTMLLQAQIKVSKTLNISAGTLSSSLTADEKNSIAYLSLTGTIDARDFKTMRDSMPVLAELDLSGVSVTGYTGTLGTKDTTSFSYYANEIPFNAFLDKTSLVSVKLPTNIVSIQQSAFQRCSGLTGTFEIPNSVIKFGGYTFYDCTGLSDFNIPKNLSSVGIFAFVRCKCSVNVDSENQNLSSDNGILFNKTKTSLIYYPTSKTGGYSIPSTVSNIEDAAFAYCKDLTSVEIPTSVTRIGQWSFDFCDGLTSITLPENLKSIGFCAFRNCSGLTSVNVPKTVTSIGGNAFITPNLTSIYAYGDTPVNISSSPGVFESMNKTTCTLFVPFGSKTVYESANQWQDFSNIVEMPGFKLSSTNATLAETEGSTASVSISADVAWNITSDQTWLTVTPSSGTGNQTLTFTANANSQFTSRKATVTVSATGIEPKYIEVTQNALPILTVSADSLVIGASANSNGTFKITSYTDWTATSNQSWLTLNPSSFVNSSPYAGTFTASGVRVHPTAGNIFFNNKEELLTMVDNVTIQKDFVGDFPYKTQIQITDNTILVDGKTMIKVNVAVTDPAVPGSGMFDTDQSGNPTNYFDPSTRTYYLSYYYYTAAPRKIYEVLKGTSNTSTITLTASENPTSINRQATITITASGVPDNVVVVTQTASPVIAVSTNSLFLAPESNSSITFNINSTTNWTISSNQDWLNVSKTEGSKNDSIILTATANQTYEDRNATITVTAEGGITQIISVKQFGIVPVSGKWNQFFNGQSSSEISVVNQNVIWVSGTSGKTITYTQDGGNTWSTKNLPAELAGKTGGISAVSATTAYIICSSGDALGLYKTTDGANTWTLQSTGFSNNNPTNFYGYSFPDFVYFWDTDNGLTYGDDNEIYITSDGGVQWNRVLSPELRCGSGEWSTSSQSFYKVAGNTIYILVGAQANSRSRILKSTDKGLTWSSIIPPTNTTSASFDFKDDNNGLYVDYSTNPSKLYSITDGGQNWALINTSENLRYIKYIPNQNIYVSNNLANGLLYSTNNGQTWTTHPSFKNVRTYNEIFSLNGTTYLSGMGYIYSSQNIAGVNTSVELATVKGSTSIDLTFSKDLVETSSNDTANYVITYKNGNTVQRIKTLSALRDNSNYALVHLVTQTALPLDTITINVKNVTDLDGYPTINSSSSSSLSVILNLALSATNLDIGANENSTNTFSITSNLPWEIASDQAWLTPDVVNGSGNSTITLTASVNNTSTGRTATVTVSSDGFEPQIINVHQADLNAPIEVTAGNLKNLFSAEELNTITKLTLSGTIDARDFRTMRDLMPMLAYLDLSDISILEYTGNEGTLNANVYYSSNSVPESALNSKVSLISVILGNSITSISYEAFLGCSSLESVVLPSSLISIASRAFGWCGLNSITFPDALQSIGNYAFSTNNIQSVDIPASVQTIGLAVFYQNRSLSEISVNPDNPNYCSIDGVLFNKNHTELLFYPNGKTNTNYVLPDGVQKIKANSFNGGNSYLKNLIIPEGVVEIESWAFANLGSLESIEIPSTISVIAGGAFIGQHVNLKSIKIYKSTPVAIGQDDLGEVNKTTCILYVPFGSKAAYQAAAQWQDFSNIVEMDFSPEIPLNITAGGLAGILPESILDTLTFLKLTGTIDARDFKTMRDEMPLLEKLDLSNVSIVAYNGTGGTSIEGNTNYPANAIPEYAFLNGSWQGKNSLNSVIFPVTLYEIGKYSFTNCNGLTIIDLPNGLTKIGSTAFATCNAIISVYIPKSVNLIEEGAFRGCPGYIYVDADNSDYSGSDGVLFNKNKTELIQFPTLKTGTYKIPFGVNIIGSFSFFNCQYLTGIEIPNSVVEIKWSAFFGCPKLTEVEIPKSVTTLENGAFQTCHSLVSVKIPMSVKNIQSRVFYDCINLNSITSYLNTPTDLTLSQDVFKDVNKTTCTLFVPYGSKAAYQAANQWQDFQNIVEMDNLNLFDEVNIIRNGKFDHVESNGMPTFWGGWVDGSYGASPNPCNVVDGVAVLENTMEHPNENWHYQFSQSNLTALQNIPYIVSFVAWADNERQIGFDFEDIPDNGYNRYGTSSDSEALWGRSEWEFNITTVPTRYTFHVTFNQILPSTIQNLRFFLSKDLGKVNLDSVSLISENDLIIIDSLPVVKTLSISSVSSGSAVCEGNVVSSEKYPVSERGVCWSISAKPTIADSKTNVGSGNGNFAGNITGLKPNTTYFARAYATNVKGTSYGSILEFKTSDCSGIIGLVGSFNSWGTNNSDVILQSDVEGECTWNVIQKFNAFSEVKFRKNYSWDINWGNWNFPMGIAVQNGPNIPVNAGTYLISFNSSTGEYNFETINVKCNEQDSLALVAIYNATNGANWSRKDNWLTGNVNTWYGVTMNTDGRITELNLARNGLNGYLPSEAGNLTELKKLHLGNNMFVVNYGNWNYLSQQPLPVSLANLFKLEILSLDNLAMFNEMPDIFGGMAELRELYIFYCYFNNQSLPGSIVNCVNLTRLDIYYNNFYQLPDLTSLKNLNIFQAQGCYLSFDDIEPNLWIPQFYYSGQQLILGNPETINPEAGENILRTINVGGSNNVYQWLKDGLELPGQNTNTLLLENVDAGDAGIYSLRVTSNLATQLTLGSHPIILYQNQLPVYKALEALYNSTGGDNWNYNTNWLSNQPITTWFGINVNASNGLIYMSLYNNNLVGTLPAETGDLSGFYQLQFSNNPGLTGEIPSSIGKLNNLQYLYLYDNNLTGSIPASVGNMTNLQYLYVRNNNLSGNLPVEIGNMSNLYYLEISGNQIESIPAEITNCSNLRYFQFNNNRISGLPNLAGMDYLYRVYAQNNKLEFDDVVPMVGQIDILNYAPQDSIGESLAVTKQVGESFSYTLVTPGNQNQYQWYKDGVLLEDKTNATIELSSLIESDKGKYYCLVTNPQAPNLTLVSRKITLNVESVDNLKMLSLTSLVPLSNIMNARAFCNLSNNEPIAVRFTNSGKKSVSNIILGFKVDGITVAEEIFTGTINPGDTLDYTFAKKADLSTTQYYKSFAISCYLVYNDESIADNSITKTRNTFGNYTDLPGWTTYNSCDGMLSDISWAIAEDKKGNIWSTDFFGASKFDGLNWTTYTTANGMGQAYNWAMINDRSGNIWMTGSNNSVITKFDGSQFIKFPQNGIYDECIYEDSKGNIWFGSWSGYGVLKFDGNNWTQYPAADYGFGNYVVSIGEDKNGKIYFASANGVKTFDGTNWGTLNMSDQNLYISEIFFDSKGFTWFTSGGSFYKYDGINWDVFNSEDGTINNCEDISEDIYGNIWFAGGNEIVKYDGNIWTRFSNATGLACGIKSIYSIYCDSKGNVWTGSYGGGISKLEQTNVCPQHFHTVWEGTKGVDHMNINIIEAKYDDLDLEAGDEVGVFDGDICVGTGKLTKTIDQQNLLTIKVSRNDGSGNGFTIGHDVTYKFWDCSAESEYEVSGVHCFSNKLAEVTCQPFETGATAYVKLSGISVICQKVGFRSGWNIFSIPSFPNPAEMGVLFQPAITNSSLVKIQDEAGNSMEDWGIFGGWQDNIGSISPTEGYKIKVSKTDSIEICGVPVKYPYAIPMNSGWNIIGYPQTKAIDGLNILQQLIDRGTLLKVQDELGNSVEDWGIFGGWQNNIGNFMAGEGYKVKVSAKDTLWIYDNYPKSTTILPELAATIHFQPEFEGNGVDHMNINLVGLPVNVLRAGDELAVFDNETCVGAVTIMPQHLKNQSVSIVASAMDNEGMPGFTEGSQITLKLWKSDKNQEFALEPEILKGTETFTKHETTVASLEKYATTGVDGIADLGSSGINCYPNPFSDRINIEVKLLEDAQLHVEVLNQLGQRVKTIITKQLFPGGLHKLEWNGKNANNQAVAPGVYILHLEINDMVFYKKILYSK